MLGRSEDEDEIKITVSSEQGPLLSDLVTPFSKVTTLIHDFNKSVGLINKVGKATIPTALISLGITATSMYYQDTNTGLGFLSGGGFVLTVMSSISACFYYAELRYGRLDCVKLPGNYGTKKEEALNLIKEYGVAINHNNKNPINILNSLNKVSNIIQKNEGTDSQRKLAIKNSLVPTLFNSINSVTADSICEEVFEYAGLSKPTKR